MKMRPMKLSGDQLVFGEGALDYLKTIKGNKALIVISGGSVERNGYLQIIQDNLQEAGLEVSVFRGVEPDPKFETVLRGAEAMKQFQPDWIVGLGGGSAMDAAKAMWVFYEHPQFTTIEDVMPPNVIPPLRGKARMICIPSTSGSASEVSRSVVITDPEKKLKIGIGSMEMFPDVALLEPGLTASMPPHVTAYTGIDALTHAVEAYASTRANDISDTLAEKAIKWIAEYLPAAYHDGSHLIAREKMQLASAIAGMAFTNVSLGIVHSMAHTIGGMYGVDHGLSNGILLPYVIEYNMQDARARGRYEELAQSLKLDCTFLEFVRSLNRELNIPDNFREVIGQDESFEINIGLLAETAKNDGCTKTNPVQPGVDDLVQLFRKVYYGNSGGTSV